VDYIFRWMGSRFLPRDDRDALGIVTAGAADAVAEATPADAPTEHPGAGHERPVAATTPVVATPVVERVALPVADAHGNGNGHANGNGKAAVLASLGVTSKVAFSVSADSPSCSECGSIMVRNGSCYKCLNCGATSGCS